MENTNQVTQEEQVAITHNDCVEIAKMLGWDYKQHWNPVPEYLEGFQEQFKSSNYLFHIDANWALYTLSQIKKMGGLWRIVDENANNVIRTEIYMITDCEEEYVDFTGISMNYNTSIFEAIVLFAKWYNNVYVKVDKGKIIKNN